MDDVAAPPTQDTETDDPPDSRRSGDDVASVPPPPGEPRLLFGMSVRQSALWTAFLFGCAVTSLLMSLWPILTIVASLEAVLVGAQTLAATPPGRTVLARFRPMRANGSAIDVGGRIMDQSVIPAMVAVVDRHLDRATADCLAALPRDTRADAIHWRVRRTLPPMPPGWASLGNSIQRAVEERDPSSIIIELPDEHDEGGEALGGPWEAAMFAIMDAALGYACPDRFTSEERRLMVDRWEAVFGPPGGAIPGEPGSMKVFGTP